MSDSIAPPPSLSRQQRRALARRKTKASQPGAGAALVLGAMGAIGGLAPATPAAAATFTVSNLNDSGAGSLRQAILDANGMAGPDVVDFQAGLSGTITLTGGELAVKDSVSIQGPGAASLTVSGNNSSRVFYLYDSANLIDVGISGLTITGGSATNGGGILDTDENLVLDQVAIQGNTASGNGGGVWFSGLNGSLTVTRSTISGNVATDGAGVFLQQSGAPNLIQDTILAGNQASDDGGALAFDDPQSPISIERSTIAGNDAGDRGGGIDLQDPNGGTLTLRETTISGNDAAAGGGISFVAPYNLLSLENTTVSGNDATAGAGGGIAISSLYAGALIRHSTIASNSATTTGGGIQLDLGRVTMENTIVGDDTAPVDPDLSGGGTFDLAFDLVESPGAATINDNGGNLFNQDPQLAPLADYGGPTETHRPAATSPAVEAGDPSFTPPPSTDQRGFPRVAGSRLDMGAVELSPGTIQFALSAVSVGENAGTVTITATRTGGTDGAVGATYATMDGTAMSPADFLAAMGTFNWADGDAAPKSIQVTIVDDAVPEGNETFTVVLSAPTGGAALGSPSTEAVTIQDNDSPGTAEIPTLGELGELLLAGLLGAAGLLALRRRG